MPQVLALIQEPPFQIYELETTTQGVLQVQAVDSTPGPTGPAGPAGPAGATGPMGPTGASGGAARILREIYFADGSKQTISSSGTVNTTSAVWPDATSVLTGGAYRFWLVPGGNGGGRGSRQLLSSTPGSGGVGGGAVFDRTIANAEIMAYVAAVGGSVAITVGVKGAGAAALASGTSSVARARGTQGTLSAFGSLFAAYPGGLEAVANGLPGAGGGWLGPGETNASGDATGGMPNGNTPSAEKDGGFGGGHGPGVTNDPATNRVGGSVYGGGAGGTSNSEVGTAAAARPAGSSQFGVPGSGSGGGVNTALTAAGKGGDAGRRGINLTQAQPPAAFVGGGPVGGNGGVDADSQPGADGTAGILGLYPGESGAGSGAVITTAAGARTVARGGDGGFPGGCGGASGEAFPFSGAIAISRGGNPADGVVVIDTF